MRSIIIGLAMLSTVALGAPPTTVSEAQQSYIQSKTPYSLMLGYTSKTGTTVVPVIVDSTGRLVLAPTSTISGTVSLSSSKFLEMNSAPILAQLQSSSIASATGFLALQSALSATLLTQSTVSNTYFNVYDITPTITFSQTVHGNVIASQDPTSSPWIVGQKSGETWTVDAGFSRSPTASGNNAAFVGMMGQLDGGLFAPIYTPTWGMNDSFGRGIGNKNLIGVVAPNIAIAGSAGAITGTNYLGIVGGVDTVSSVYRTASFWTATSVPQNGKLSNGGVIASGSLTMGNVNGAVSTAAVYNVVSVTPFTSGPLGESGVALHTSNVSSVLGDSNKANSKIRIGASVYTEGNALLTSPMGSLGTTTEYAVSVSTSAVDLTSVACLFCTHVEIYNNSGETLYTGGSLTRTNTGTPISSNTGRIYDLTRGGAAVMYGVVTTGPADIRVKKW